MIETEMNLDAFPHPCAVLNPDGELVQENRQWKEEISGLLGFDPSGLKSVNLFSDDDTTIRMEKDVREKLLPAVQEVLNGAQSHTGVMMSSAELRPVWYRFSVRPLDKNSGSLLVVIEDVSGQMQMLQPYREARERELERQRDLNYRLMVQLFEHSTNAIVLVNRENRIERCNQAFEVLFGYESEQAYGRNVDELLIPEGLDEEEKEFTGRTLSGTTVQRETLRCSKEGREIPVLLGTIPVWLDGEVVYAYGIYVDLSDRVLLERENRSLLHTEKQIRSELVVLLQEVHHRVKNNLAVIIGLMDLQMLDEEDPELNFRLRQVQRRIYSIARIHESIYEQDDLLRVHLDLYIKSMAGSWQQQAIGHGRELVLKVEHVRLNVNQAVTAGLVLNELFNLAEFSNHRFSADPYLALNQVGVEIQIRFGIPGYPMVKFDDDDPEGFNAKVLSVLLNQLNAHCGVNPEQSDELCIRFLKADVKGSSSSFI
ncbi:MAG: sensor histidine kinase [Bacteroidota bacterium]